MGASAAGNVADFQAAADVLGPLTIRRSFDAVLPTDFASSAGGKDGAVGLHSFVSWKPPGGDFLGATSGRYDTEIEAWAKSVPPTGVYATAYHEPENDMDAAQFVTLQRHLYTVVKRVNPTIRWGPVYMAYWWDPGMKDHYVGDPASWWPGDNYADFAGLDWYAPRPTPMTLSPSFLNWYGYMAGNTNKPLIISEYGQYAVAPGSTPDPVLENRRAKAIRQDAQWIAWNPRIRMWMYWQGVGAQGDWRLEDPASQAAWREVAGHGCRTPPAAVSPPGG